MWEYLAMGGYAAFVWPAFALTALVMIGLLVESLSALKAHQTELARLEGDRPRERRRPGKDRPA
ncbi:MAG: heme exporter protein CcmD [Kiloniellales bacterium]